MIRKKILITGGHLSPALAVIEELGKNNYYEIHYLGRLRAFEGDETRPLEAQILHRLNIPYYPLVTGRLERYFSLSLVFSLLKIPIGLIQSFVILRKIKPHVILSFGGYVALPVCLAATIMRIPIITHEQTRVLGLTNKIIARLSKYLCLSWKETTGVPSGVKIVLTGIPIRRDILLTQRVNFPHPGDAKLPLIYITGGSLGSMVINEVVSELIPQLVKEFKILHQCGGAENETDYKKLLRLRDNLAKLFQKNYLVVKYLDPDQVGVVLREATILIGRSGANTVAEAAVSELPAIFIPLPWAGGNEQEYNASILKESGQAIIIKQQDLNGEILFKTIKNIMADYKTYKTNARQTRKFYPLDAARKIVELL